MGKWVTIKPEASFLAITCVQTRDDFVRALELCGTDLILSDFDLPAFDGLAAAEIVRTKWSIIPFIFVSGSLAEELVIYSFKCGATDFVSKSRFLF
jgi:DNA-binding response OmpR family regulator